MSFDDAFDSLLLDKKPSIILGNGFSQSWNSDIFNYSQLYNVANFGERHEAITAIFTHLDTFDFEKVMQSLISAETILSIYDKHNPLILRIKEDQDILKNALINAISEKHPALPSAINNDSYVVARGFLSKFSNIFTLNYDLLVYWAKNKETLAPVGYNIDDGFRAKKKWQGFGTEQRVHCLHGGIYIYEEQGEVKKHACTYKGTTIIEQVRANLKENKFPLFVSEPTSQKKKERIKSNAYLYFCFRKLKRLDGVIFIHGHSFDENDRHIFTELDSSSVDKVYISIFGDEFSEQNRQVKANANAFLASATRSVEFYQAETTPIWKEDL